MSELWEITEAEILAFNRPWYEYQKRRAKLCAILGCQARHYARGMCRKHYNALPENREKRHQAQKRGPRKCANGHHNQHCSPSRPNVQRAARQSDV